MLPAHKITPGGPSGPTSEFGTRRLSENELAHSLALDEWNKMVQKARSGFGVIREEDEGDGTDAERDDPPPRSPSTPSKQPAEPIMQRRRSNPKKFVEKNLREEISSKKNQVAQLEKQKAQISKSEDEERVTKLEKEINELRDRNKVFEMMFTEMLQSGVTPGGPGDDTNGNDSDDDIKNHQSTATGATLFGKRHSAALQLLSPNPSAPIPKRFILNHVDDQEVYTVGRQKGAVDLWLDSTRIKNFISRIHAQFEFSKRKTWMIVDRNSVNGIFVNDVKISTHELRHGDVITFGGAAELRVGEKGLQTGMSEFRYVFQQIKRPTLSTDSDANDDTEAQDPLIKQQLKSQAAQLESLQRIIKARDEKQQNLEAQNKQLERRLTEISRQQTVPMGMDEYSKQGQQQQQPGSPVTPIPEEQKKHRQVRTNDIPGPFDSAAMRNESNGKKKAAKGSGGGRICTSPDDVCSVM